MVCTSSRFSPPISEAAWGTHPCFLSETAPVYPKFSCLENKSVLWARTLLFPESRQLPEAGLKLHCSSQVHLNILMGISSALRRCLGVTGRYFLMFCQQTDFWHLFLHWDVPILLWRFVYTQGIKMLEAPGVSMKGTKKSKSKAIWSLNHLNWEGICTENWAESWPGQTENSS